MRKITNALLLICTAVVLVFSFEGCKSKEEKRAEFKAKAAEEYLTNFAAEFNAPSEGKEKAGKTGMIKTGYEYRDKTFTIRYKVEKKKVFKKLMSDNSQGNSKKQVKERLLNQTLFNNIINAQATVRCVYKYEGDSVVQTFTPTELEE